MGHAVAITDGTTTINLSDRTTTGIALIGYNPAIAKPNEDTGVMEPVVDTVDFWIEDTSIANLAARARGIHRLLWQVNHRQRSRTGPRVYLLYTPTSGSQLRSEIFAYQLHSNEANPILYNQFRQELSLVVTRAPFWEGARTQIPLTNGNGTNNTAGLRIYNHNDAGAGHDNWVDIAAADVTGDYPAPLELEYTNDTGGAVDFNFMHIGNNWFAPTMQSTWEAENQSGGQDQVDATASNGYTNYVTGSGWKVWQWTLTTAFLNLTRGRYFRVIGRFTSTSGSLRIRTRLLDLYGITVQGRAVYTAITGSGVWDCGALPLPNSPYADNAGDVILEVAAYSSDSRSVYLDFIELLAAEPGQYQRFDMIGYDTANGDKIVSNGPDELLYYLSGTQKFFVLRAHTDFAHVMPNVNQRLVSVWDPATSKTWSLKAYYRPRKAAF
jgi:hypothetical protein